MKLLMHGYNDVYINMEYIHICLSRFINFFRRNKPARKLPRTWGREWLLLCDKGTYKSLLASDLKLLPVYAIMILVILPISVAAFLNLDNPTSKVCSGIISAFCAFFIILLIWSFKNVHRDFLRPIYFSRLAKEKGKDRDSKMEAVKKQFPEAKYRIASLTPPQNAVQVRALLEADHPLTREQLAKAVALLEAEKEAEDAQKKALLAQAQAKP
ncbi:hypothetical protein GF391_01935 [Candidatus Uhrbacteria bacterium]|nr:hypothetical protein [Candidatus Uhrbacteria bacterium]